MGACTAVQSTARFCHSHGCSHPRRFHSSSARADAASYPRTLGTARTESADVLFHPAPDARHGADTRHHAQCRDNAASAVRLCGLLRVHAGGNELPEHFASRLCVAIIRHRLGADDSVHLRRCGKAVPCVSARPAECGKLRLGAQQTVKQDIPAGVFFGFG